VVELALANIPGFTLTSPPSDATPAIMHWPALVSSSFIEQNVYINGTKITVAPVSSGDARAIDTEAGEAFPGIPPRPGGKSIRIPFGRLFATRSGDKGGNANLGIWTKTPLAFSFLRDYLTTERLKELMQDIREYEIERYEFPNLLAINFYIKGILGDGVAASLRSDPQAKTLGEYIRAKIIEAPESIIG